jgi:predicted NBD/HSP70 family sugar kinase
LEAYVSGWAITKEGQKRISKKIKEAKEVFDLARENHPEAKKIIKEMAAMLGIGAANLVNILGVETIYLGGKIIKSADLFLKSAQQAAQKNIFQSKMRNFSFKTSQLKEKAGLIGAAYWALKNSNLHKV